MHGNTPLTERLLKPALVDTETDMREMPLYVTTLPQRFSDYGGTLLKIIRRC